MKSFKKFLAVAVAVLLMVSTTACSKKQKYDPETRPLVMSLSTPDGVFNPFFATSGYDSTVLGMTQVGMLSSDEEGNVVYGDNEPVVVKDMRETYDAATDRTTYEFIIKNGIRFSDGVPLTINDVLFNLYVYLDPVYTGSATIYSTDIVGLNDYRTQEEGTSDSSMSSFEESFVSEAKVRIDDLVEFVQCFGQYNPGAGGSKPADRWTADEKTANYADFVTVAKTFREELYTDWNNTLDSMESYEDWQFTAPWQVFLLNDGQSTELLATDVDGNYIKDDEGNYRLNVEQAAEYEADLNAYKQAHSSVSADEATKEWAVNTVYLAYFPTAIDLNTFDYDESAFSADNVASAVAATQANKLEETVRFWVTADTVLTQFTAEQKSAYFATVERTVPTISGIDGTGTTVNDFHGHALGASHSVLSITINGVDPKAIWNFAFTVAPLHYYSGTYTNAKGETKNYVQAFDQTRGEFGLEYGDINFMNNVINAPSKIGLPLGAGVYMASTANGGVARSAGDFMNLNMLYYERNPYFTTLGSGIENAKIKYFRYRVVETDQIINSIATKEIDVGDPNATQDNIRKLQESGIAHKEIYTNGYGYVGINPRFVPNIDVRRAIMKAMDTQSIVNDYYQGGLAELIYRPMTTTSWAYPKGATVYSSKTYGQVGITYDYDDLGNDIEDIVYAAGYRKVGGVYQKEIKGFGVDRLDYQFTIAGSSSDHPLYNVFLNAQRILNKHGFAVKVVTSQSALSDLTTGKLAVWAAAWSSTIDPDMYQVYHMDSQATSVNNWGYKQIKANKTELYDSEWRIVVSLSEAIDAGRNTTDQEARAACYAQALDLVMELAVEMPTYQRKDMTAYNADLIDTKTLTPEEKQSPYNGLFARIWEVNYN